MFLLALNLFLGSAGLTVMVIATYRFHKLIKHAKEATYNAQHSKRHAAVFSVFIMYSFVAAFIFGITSTLVSPPGSARAILLAVFFFGAIFVYFTVNSQISMTMLLREKNMEIMKTFVNAIDLKDSYTKGHSEHVYALVSLIYNYLPEHSRERLSRPKLLDAAMLHDCGKISIKDEVLNKRGRLTAEDWESIRGHAAMGKKMLDDTCFSDISDWVLYHHERIDGKGYYGLAADEIPLESRIIAIADTYSALSTDRVYRKRYSHEQAIEIMALSTGSQLDSALMGCFMRIPFKDLQEVHPHATELHVEQDKPVNAVIAGPDTKTSPAADARYLQ